MKLKIIDKDFSIYKIKEVDSNILKKECFSGKKNEWVDS